MSLALVVRLVDKMCSQTSLSRYPLAPQETDSVGTTIIYQRERLFLRFFARSKHTDPTLSQLEVGKKGTRKPSVNKHCS